MIFLLVAAVIAIPFAPEFPLWLGIILVGLCALALIPKVNAASRWFLRLPQNRKWASGLRVTMYGLIGLVLILGGIAGEQLNAEQDRIAAEQAAREIEQQRLVAKANQTVESLTSEAEEYWKSGQLSLAEDTLHQAERTQHATNLAPVKQLRSRMANAQVDDLMQEAVKAVTAADFSLALQKVQEALAIPNATTLEGPRELQGQIANAIDSKHIKNALMDLSDEEFEEFRESQALPTELASGYDALDRRAFELAQSAADEVAATRERRRQERIAQERAAAEADVFVKTGVGKTVPFDKWDILGNPRTLDDTNNRYWVAYLDKVNVSFVSEKSSNIVIFAAFGERAASEFLAEKDKKRKRRIEGGFSVWDGSHRELTKVIKASMNDPKSYKHVDTVYWDQGDYLIIRTTFRGKNAFGGVVVNWVEVKADLDGHVLEIIEWGP